MKAKTLETKRCPVCNKIPFATTKGKKVVILCPTESCPLHEAPVTGSTLEATRSLWNRKVLRVEDERRRGKC